MELTCSRCHQTVQAADCFCPYCGLPQLVYSSDASGTPVQAERQGESARDASTIDWKPAMRLALALAVPAGALCALLTRVGVLGLLLMPALGAGVVALYLRHQRSAWITIGAGARIGLVTGVLVGCLSFMASAGTLFIERYGFNQGQQIDNDWKGFVNLDMQVSQQVTAMIGPADPAQVQAERTQMEAWMLSPDGHAGMVVANLAWGSVLFVFFSVAGGALGARLLGRPRRSGI